jgi:hypothetical protein
LQILEEKFPGLLAYDGASNLHGFSSDQFTGLLSISLREALTEALTTGYAEHRVTCRLTCETMLR